MPAARVGRAVDVREAAPLDRAWETRGHGVLVRYVDDLVVMCTTELEARRTLAALRAVLGELGLEPKDAKTRIVHLREGGEGFDLLGFHHRYVRGRTRRSPRPLALASGDAARTEPHSRADGAEAAAVPVEEVV